MRKILFLLCVALIGFSIYLFRLEEKPPEIIYPEATSAVQIPPTFTAVLVQNTAVIEVLPTATPSPTPVLAPMVAGPVLTDRFGNVVDLSSGKSTYLAIRLPDGGELRSTWAKAYFEGLTGWDPNAYPPESPYSKAVYSSITGGTVTLIRPHSGVLGLGELFGQAINSYLSQVPNVQDGQQRILALVGSSAYICQTNEEMASATRFEGDVCPGVVVEMEITAATLVTQDYVANYRYDEALANDPSLPVYGGLAWLVTYNPGQVFNPQDEGSRFDFFSSADDILTSTCVNRYSNQGAVPGVHDYSFNRAVFSFKLLR